MKIYCCECEKQVDARFTNGQEIYPHRPDLFKLKFYKCDACGSKIGCHESNDRPLGCMPNKVISNARSNIHRVMDPLWKSGKMSRNAVYRHISKKIGYNYHTGNVRTIKEATMVFRIVERLSEKINQIK